MNIQQIHRHEKNAKSIKIILFHLARKHAQHDRHQSVNIKLRIFI